MLPRTTSTTSSRPTPTRRPARESMDRRIHRRCRVVSRRRHLLAAPRSPGCPAVTGHRRRAEIWSGGLRTYDVTLRRCDRLLAPRRGSARQFVDYDAATGFGVPAASRHKPDPGPAVREGHCPCPRRRAQGSRGAGRGFPEASGRGSRGAGRGFPEAGRGFRGARRGSLRPGAGDPSALPRPAGRSAAAQVGIACSGWKCRAGLGLVISTRAGDPRARMRHPPVNRLAAGGRNLAEAGGRHTTRPVEPVEAGGARHALDDLRCVAGQRRTPPRSGPRRRTPWDDQWTIRCRSARRHLRVQQRPVRLVPLDGRGVSPARRRSGSTHSTRRPCARRPRGAHRERRIAAGGGCVAPDVRTDQLRRHDQEVHRLMRRRSSASTSRPRAGRCAPMPRSTRHHPRHSWRVDAGMTPANSSNSAYARRVCTRTARPPRGVHEDHSCIPLDERVAHRSQQVSSRLEDGRKVGSGRGSMTPPTAPGMGSGTGCDTIQGAHEIAIGLAHLRSLDPEIHSGNGWVDQWVRPSGQTSETHPVPRPRLSLQREPNHPSSRTEALPIPRPRRAVGVSAEDVQAMVKADRPGVLTRATRGARARRPARRVPVVALIPVQPTIAR